MPEPVPNVPSRVLAAMRRHADAGVCTATHADLLATSGLVSRTTLSDALAQLTAAGCVALIERCRHPNPSRWHLLTGEPRPSRGWEHWPADTEHRLLAMRDAGAKPGEIAAALGMTRGQVAGKLFRLEQQEKGAVSRAFSASSDRCCSTTDRHIPEIP